MIFVLITKVVFWSAVSLTAYVYVGYPLIVYVISRLFPKPVRREFLEPMVTILITAYNEERDIRDKLENTLQIDYPAEKREIIVASDCSSDKTDEIVRQFASRGVKLYRQSEREGKTSAQNMGVAQAAGEIILFSDATTLYDRKVLKAMLPNFSDSTVGCVAGKLIYRDSTDSAVGNGAKRYWDYETFLKESESRVCSLIGASGCLYAIRKSVYLPMYPEACSDFLIATNVFRQGFRTVFEPSAVCFEKTNQCSGEEMRMRIRVVSQTCTDLWRNREILNPFRSGFFSLELISHKVLRYCVPVFLLLSLVASMVLAFYSEGFLAILIVQMAFYLTALTAWFLDKVGLRSKMLALPLYFVLTSVASILGIFNFFRGERFSHWEPIRDLG